MDAASADALLARLRAGGVLYLMHVHADPDCVGSAFALQEAFPGVVGAPDGLSKDGARLADALGLAPDPWPHPENFDTVVGIDLGSRSSLGRLGGRAGDPCLVDHHRYGDLHAKAPAMAWDPARPSCCEVVLALLDRAGHVPSATAARGLLVGLLTDTARLRLADPAALRTAARLVEASGTGVEGALLLLDEEDGEDDGFDARKATLLAATRAQVATLGSFLVARSEVGAFEAAAAGALVRAGADVALVLQERSDQARVSMRASRRALGRGLHLGEVANAAAREVGWSGGGHEGAAGMRGAPPTERAFDALMRQVRAKLEGR